jgi:hypothetical protein
MWYGIIPYDPVSKEIKAMIDESVYEFYVNDEYYFYYSKTGFYCHNKLSGEKQRIGASSRNKSVPLAKVPFTTRGKQGDVLFASLFLRIAKKENYRAPCVFGSLAAYFCLPIGCHVQ